MSFLLGALGGRLGRAFVCVELSAVGGAFYVFHSINTSESSRRWWDQRAPWLIDAFHTATGNDMVVAHRVPPVACTQGTYDAKSDTADPVPRPPTSAK